MKVPQERQKGFNTLVIRAAILGVLLLVSVVSASYIRITHPYSGLKLRTGSTCTIRWESSGAYLDYVGIDLYKDGRFYKRICSSIRNTGHYDWVIPSNYPSSSSYRIKIYATGMLSVESWTGNFSITSASSEDGSGSIKVTYPYSSQRITRGTRQRIRWSSSGAVGSYVKIDLYKDGRFYKTIFSGIQNDGDCIWSVGSDYPLSNSLRIKISSTRNSSICGVSGTFAIVSANSGSGSSKGYITVTSPNGGESWQMGTRHTISWKSSGEGNVKIEIYKGQSRGIISSSTPNDGSLSWQVPKNYPMSNDYRLKITSTSNPSVFGWSNGYFSVTAMPTVKVSCPNGGERWLGGTKQRIRWQSNGVGQVKIELWRDGHKLREITPNTANDGFYDWSIPENWSESSRYQIRISSLSHPYVADRSDGYFKISQITGYISQVNIHNGGCKRGGKLVIGWTCNGNWNDYDKYVKIDLYRNGKYYRNITTGAYCNSVRCAYSWYTPSNLPLGCNYRVRVSSSKYPGIFSGWSNNFCISLF